MVETKPSERRRYPRAKSSIPLRIVIDREDAVTDTHNISKAGAYCRVSRFIEPMTKLRIQLLIPTKKAGRQKDQRISCEGVVVRIEENQIESGYNIAIFFNEISPKDADSIAEYVSTQELI